MGTRGPSCSLRGSHGPGEPTPDDKERMDGAPLSLRYRIVRPGGETRWIRARTFAIEASTKIVDRDIALLRDLTEEHPR